MGIRIKSLRLGLVLCLTILFITLSLIQVNADSSFQDNVLYVDNDWIGGSGVPLELSFGDNAFASIENAIKKADSVENDTIVVGPGIYEEDVTIDKNNLTLRSGGTTENTIIEGNISVFQGGDVATIEGFKVQADSGSAVHVREAEDVMVTGCYVAGLGVGGAVDGIKYGPVGGATESGTVSNNVVENCGLGIYIDMDGLYDFVLTGNILKNNRKAIGFGSGSGGNVENNEISGSTQMGIEVYRADKAQVHYNDIFANAIGIKNLDETQLDAILNWWGHKSGPSGIAPGEGDAMWENVVDGVDYDPWLDAPFPGGENTGFVNHDHEEINVSAGQNIQIDAITKADTEIFFDTTEGGIVSVGEYQENPGGNPPTGENAVKYVGVGTNIMMENVIIRIYYEESEISGIDENPLMIYRWNPTVDEWQAEDSTVDTANNYVEAELDHLSSFGLMTGPPPAKPPAVGGGPALPVNLLAVLAPWIALGLVVVGMILTVKLRSPRWGE